MFSENDSSERTGEICGLHWQPPQNGDSNERNMKLRDGLYIIRNKMARTVLDLWDNKDGTQCHGYSLVDAQCIGHQRWQLQPGSSNDTHTLMNPQYCKYPEVLDGRMENGSKVIPRPRPLTGANRLNQEWRIKEQAPGEYMLQCARTNTFLEIVGGSASDGAEVTCSEAAVERDHQIWDVERVSRTASEIKALFESWKPDIVPRILNSHEEQTEYFVLPHELRKSLWIGTKLNRQPVRQGLFDYNDFVIKAKDAITSWARDKFSVQVKGLSVLFGIIYGEAEKGPKAYNWYLAPDMCSLVFFDAQTGKEYGAAAIDGFGFEPTFAMF